MTKLREWYERENQNDCLRMIDAVDSANVQAMTEVHPFILADMNLEAEISREQAREADRIDWTMNHAHHRKERERIIELIQRRIDDEGYEYIARMLTDLILEIEETAR